MQEKVNFDREKTFLTLAGVYANQKVHILSGSDKPQGSYRVLITFLQPILDEEDGNLTSSTPYPIQADDYFSSILEFSLTEFKILRLLKNGYQNQQITAELHLGGGTVRNYLSGMMKKAKVSNRTQLVIKAFELGLLQEDD